MTSVEQARRGIGILPGSLGEAIALAKGSRLLRRALGNHVYQSFLQNKKIEDDHFRKTLTDYEMKTYLPLL